MRALPWKKLFDPVSPSIFFNWAREIDIELPVELISEVEKRTGITRYWFNEYKIIKAAYDELQNNNVLVSAVVETPLFDKVSSTYPPELDFAVKAWQAVSIIEGRGKPKTRIRAWLVANANDLSDEAKKRICVVANWDKRGGATRTGSK